MCSVTPAAAAQSVTIRRTPRPGDAEEIGALHGSVYGYEYGLDALALRVEIACALTELCTRGFPEPAREGLWIVDQHGRVAGSIALIDDGDRLARLRFFMLAPQLRGTGLGRELMSQVVDLATSSGAYDRIYLTTFHELEAAAVALPRGRIRARPLAAPAPLGPRGHGAALRARLMYGRAQSIVSGPCDSPLRNWRMKRLSELSISSDGPASTIRPFQRTQM